MALCTEMNGNARKNSRRAIAGGILRSGRSKCGKMKLLEVGDSINSIKNLLYAKSLAKKSGKLMAMTLYNLGCYYKREGQS